MAIAGCWVHTGPGYSGSAIFANNGDLVGMIVGGEGKRGMIIRFDGSFTRVGGHSPTVTLRLYRGTSTAGLLLATSYAGGSGVPANMPMSISAVDGGFSGNTFYFLTAESSDDTCTINNDVMVVTNYKNG